MQLSQQLLRRRLQIPGVGTGPRCCDHLLGQGGGDGLDVPPEELLTQRELSAIVGTMVLEHGVLQLGPV